MFHHAKHLGLLASFVLAAGCGGSEAMSLDSTSGSGGLSPGSSELLINGRTKDELAAFGKKIAHAPRPITGGGEGTGGTGGVGGEGGTGGVGGEGGTGGVGGEGGSGGVGGEGGTGGVGGEGGTGGTPEPTPPPPTGGNVDTFGVTMIYPTKTGGEQWFLAADPTRDPRFDPQDPITRNADGSWKMKSSQVRMHAMTSTGYNNSAITTYDRNTLAQKGYMQAPNDWKNIEMTGFVKVNAASDMSDNFAWYARGGRHSDGIGCEGSAYKGSFHYDGRTRFQKESWHVSYDQSSYSNTTTSLKGRWVGLKTVMRNILQNGKTVVKLELWLNDNADKVSWRKVYDMVDDGSWGGDSGACGASNDAMPITWGGPLATFRWDSTSDVDFKWLSVREID